MGTDSNTGNWSSCHNWLRRFHSNYPYESYDMTLFKEFFSKIVDMENIALLGHAFTWFTGTQILN